jgi:hypothetical protein
MKEAGRSLVLVPSTEMRDAVKKDVEQELCFTTFSAEDIEETKKPFVGSMRISTAARWLRRS